MCPYAWILDNCIDFIRYLFGLGQPHFEWTAEVNSAYDMVLQFRMDEAEQLALSSSVNQPDNVAWDYVLGDISKLKVLVEESPEEYSDVLNVQEWYYRNARIQIGLEEVDQAVESFKKVGETPFDNRRKFHPVSCYELGLIYLDRGYPEEAKYWLERALSYSGYPSRIIRE